MAHNGDSPQVLSKKQYEKELARLQEELVRLQEWIVHAGLRSRSSSRAAIPQARVG